MHLARTGYEVQFEAIAPDNPELGSAAMVPWDGDIFGFPVARYRPNVPALSTQARIEFAEAFRKWTGDRAVGLWICDIAANDDYWKRALPETGFTLVDFALRTVLTNLQRAEIPESRLELRPATAADHASIEQIAAGSFHHGRYHADAQFPRTWADRRYRAWIHNALCRPGDSDRVYVLDLTNEVKGFYHVSLQGNTADLRLAAVAPDLQGTLLGLELYTSMLAILRNLGVKRVVTSISPSNTGVLNIYSMLGFRFSEPTLLFHRHLFPREPEL